MSLSSFKMGTWATIVLWGIAVLEEIHECRLRVSMVFARIILIHPSISWWCNLGLVSVRCALSIASLARRGRWKNVHLYRRSHHFANSRLMDYSYRPLLETVVSSASSCSFKMFRQRTLRVCRPSNFLRQLFLHVCRNWWSPASHSREAANRYKRIRWWPALNHLS